MRQHTWKAPLCDIQMHIPHYITHPSASPCPNIRYRRCLPMASTCPSAHMPPSSSYQVRYPTIYRAVYAGRLETHKLSHGGRGIARKLRHRGKVRRRKGQEETRGRLRISHPIEARLPKQPMGVANLGIGKPILLQGKQAPLVLLIRLAENPASFFL